MSELKQAIAKYPVEDCSEFFQWAFSNNEAIYLDINTGKTYVNGYVHKNKDKIKILNKA